MATPHDLLFHSTFRHPCHAGPWLQWLLPERLSSSLAWEEMRLHSSRIHGVGLRQYAADLVFEVPVRGTNHRVFLVVEHRSFAHPGLHDTLVRYCVHLAHAARRHRSTPPVSVIAVVLYHGPGNLVLRPQVAVDLDPATTAVLGAFRPRQRVIPDLLSACSEAQLRDRPLTALGTLTQLGLRFLPHLGPAATLAALDRWGGLLRAVDADRGPPDGRDAIDTFGGYLLHVNETPAEDVHMALERNLQRTEEKIMSTAEKLRQEGIAEGLRQGLTQGLSQGLTQGLSQGLTQGLTQGRVETLLRLLARRFGSLPAAVEPRLRAASLLELDRWADRVLDAPTLEAVFAAD